MFIYPKNTLLITNTYLSFLNNYFCNKYLTIQLRYESNVFSPLQRLAFAFQRDHNPLVARRLTFKLNFVKIFRFGVTLYDFVQRENLIGDCSFLY